jgi:hypothetical protein
MKRKTTYLCLFIILVSLLISPASFAQTSSDEEASLGRKMVTFIRKILGDEPKTLDESLVRDEL